MRILLVILCLCFNYSFQLKFFSGRPRDRYGFLGLPNTNKTNLLSSSNEDLWFEEQRLDHFDPTNTKTWRQRYFLSKRYFNASNDSPIFLELGGEGEGSPKWVHEGQAATNYAKQYQAMSIYLEHRFYGKSRPTSDLSTENLKYLTSQQALQDIANFIEFIRRKHNLFKNKWVIFGGSYSGSLAAWFRLKYPHLVVGAVASSAPIQAKLNFKEYIEVVENSLGSKCVQEIKKAIKELTNLLNTEDGWQTITEMFHLCSPLNATNPMDVSNLIENLAGYFEGTVQYNNDNRINLENLTIAKICSIMEDSKLDPIERLAAVNKKFINNDCFQYEYQQYLDEMLSTDFESGSSRQWMYQTCTEFGFYQTSDSPDHPFGDYFPLKYFTQQCQDIFGKKFNQKFIQNGIDFTNNFYGGFNLTLTNVIFPNGLVDPWHALGVLYIINPTALPLIIQDTAHCADMYPDSPNDSPLLRIARDIIKEQIGKFLKDPIIED